MTAQTTFFRVVPVLAKLLLHLRIDGFAVGFSARFGHHDFHHGPHLRFAGRAGCGDRVAHQRRQLFGRKRRRKISFQHGLLGFFFGGLLRASAFFESLHRILALLDALAHDADHLGLGQVPFAARAFFDDCVFEGRLQHAQGSELVRILGPHRVLQILINFCRQTHPGKLNRLLSAGPAVSRRRPLPPPPCFVRLSPAMTSSVRKIPVLGTPVAAVDYSAAVEETIRLAGQARPAAVAASNTHIVALARRDATFGEVMRRFDLVLPDGMPLRWALNARGAQLGDRVYGPYFMREMIRATPRPWRHFLFGGTEATLSRLESTLREIQPDLEIAGTLSPPFRDWTSEDEAAFARAIAEARADFIWVALGGERQERWIVENLPRHQRGVFCAVGDAFVLLGGGRSFAPQWMQQLGITWVYRLWQEPGRLWRRYAQFNSLFVWYTLRDAILGAPREPTAHPSVAFLGSRGVPARYSGFEVVVEELGKRLAAAGYPVTVYNRLPRHGPPGEKWEGMQIIGLPTVPTKNLDTIVHTTLSMLHAMFRRYDIIYLCGVGNATLIPLARAVGTKVVINVDGADFSRKKWGRFARFWLRRSERLAVRWADAIIADNVTIADRYERVYGRRPEHLSYGLTFRNEPVSCGELDRWNLTPGNYFLYVSRLTPENEASLLLEAYRRLENPLPLVIVGADPYEHAYRRRLVALATDRVIFTGLRFGDAYLELSQHARAFIMPATIDATRLVLLDQIGLGRAIIYHDCAATREVLGDAGIPFGPQDPVGELAAKLTLAQEQPGLCDAAARRARRRAELFRWETVVRRYGEIFRQVLGRA